MPGAVIQVKGTTIGTVTDVEGRFGINAKENSTLVISMIGYKTVEINIRNNTSVTVRLEENTIGLEEVVVIGYGTASKRELTTSVSTVQGAVLQNVAISSVGEGLKGKMPGVRVTSVNNSPGSETEFRIRGGSSIHLTNDPLDRKSVV